MGARIYNLQKKRERKMRLEWALRDITKYPRPFVTVNTRHTIGRKNQVPKIIRKTVICRFNMDTKKQVDSRCGVKFGVLDLTLGENHPFTVVCRYEHDAAYEAMLKGFPGRDAKEVDKAAFTAWWGIAKNKKGFEGLKLKAQALAFYPIIRLYSLFRWKGK